MGIITIDDVYDIIQEEVGKILKMVGYTYRGLIYKYVNSRNGQKWITWLLIL